MALRLQAVPAARGALWLRQGFRVFLRRPFGFVALLLGFFLLSVVVSVLLPFVGGVLTLMALPLLSLAFMIVTQTTASGNPARWQALTAPLRERGPRRAALLKLCALYGIAALAVLLVLDQTVGDVFDQIAQLSANSSQPSPEEVQAVVSTPQFMLGLGLRAVLLALLSVPFWHAPALILWGDQGVAQSLFSSTVACWRCKGAFAVYGVIWIGILVALDTLTAVVFGVLGLDSVAVVAMVPLTMMALAVFYASLYFTFVDSFAPVKDETESAKMT